MAKMPIRNKSKDNPYTLGYSEDKKVYIVEFRDNKKETHKVEVSREVYDAFDRFELDDISDIHKYRKHIEHSEIYEQTLHKKAVNISKSVEDIVEENIINDNLKKAIECLSDTQKRRVKMYYFEDMTLKQIAEIEHCSIMSVKESIDTSIMKLKKILKF